ncbi:hypothetical protein [Actinomyces slackii]|uniref:hypothetical protein n=1 Tax=Actinomyces slackii TaxID=52774 RepID=UPI000419FBB0
MLGLTAYDPSLFGCLTSKLAGLLVVGVLGLTAYDPSLFGCLMSKLMGILIGRGGGI